jgi:GTP-binding protein LepA
MALCQERRVYTSESNTLPRSGRFTLDMPLAEILIDFMINQKHEPGLREPRLQLYRTSRERCDSPGYRLNGDPVDALSMIVHKDSAYNMGAT